MEQVLAVYERKYDPKHPVICFDERPCQLIDNVIIPTPAQPGRVRREDYHYKRCGTAVVLLAVEPLTGKRIVQVTLRKTKKEYAEFMKMVAQEYPHAEDITMIQDNLNTHHPASFYQRYPASEAFRLTSKIKMVFTPKKASWLNMAEIEFSALARQCLKRRIPTFKLLSDEVYAWTRNRNKKQIKIQWQFSLRSARIKFRRAYINIRK